MRPGYALRPFTLLASSSTRPSLVARMLEDLEVADGTARRSADHLSSLPELTPDQLFDVRETTTNLDPAALGDPAFRFFLQLHLGTGRSDHYRVGDRDCASVVADDGSWAEVAVGHHLVRYDGTHNPWETVEQTHHLWNSLGRPGTTDLGLTVTPAAQYVWHRTPDSAWTHSI